MIGFTGEANENLVIPVIFENDGSWYRVTSIGDYAFDGCNCITGLIIPDSVVNIGDYAFRYCQNLKEVYVGNGVKKIGIWSFGFCNNIAAVHIQDLTAWCNISFAGQASNPLEANNDTQGVGSNLYLDGKLLTDLVIPKDVTKIADYTFSHCHSITSVTISDTVTSIGEWAFYACSNLTSVTIPDSVTTIGYEAFRFCSELTSVTIGNSVTTIGNSAFQNCYRLTNAYYTGGESEWEQITIGSNNDYLTNATRYYYSETEPTTEGNFWHYVDGVPTVWEAHKHTEAILSAVAPTCTETGLTEGKYCTTCGKTIVEQNIVPVIEHSYDDQCDTNCNVCGATRVVSGHVFDHDCDTDCNVCGFTREIEHQFDNDCDDICNVAGCGYARVTYHNYESVGTPSADYATVSVTYTCSTCGHTYSETITPTDFTVTAENRIMVGFTGEANENLVIPAVFVNDGTWYRVTKINPFAFGNCKSLKKVNIPASISHIEVEAFHDCFALNWIEVDSNNKTYCSIDGNLYTKDGKELVRYALGKTETEFIVPDGVESIGHYSFYFAPNLTHVILNNEVTCINTWAFQGCGALESIVLTASVKEIELQAFQYCDSLTVVYYTGTAEEWNSIIIDNEYDDNIALLNATRYYYSETQPTTEGNFWHYVDGVPTVWEAYVAPNYSLGLEYTSNGDGTCYVSGFGTCTDTDIIIPSVSPNGETVIGVGDRAFGYMAFPISSVVIPDSVTIIGREAFAWCEALTSVTIGNKVTHIGSFAFGCCSSLEKIDIPQSVTQIELDAFQICDVLSCIEVSPDNKAYRSIDGNLYTKDGKELVKYAAGKNDTTFIIPDGVETIGVYSVYYSTKITNIVMPDSVISIQAWAFQGCTSLTNVKLSNNIESIGYEAFGDCSSLMTIVIPNSIKTIGGNFFNWLSVLETVYYEGCESDWSKISIEENEYFFKATLYYYSETQPTTEGNFWHYVDGVPTVWEAHKHTEAILSAVASTCTETGLTEGKYCTTCGKIIVEQNIVPVVDHTEVIDLAVEPTCIQTGLTAGKHCAACGKIIVEQNIVPVVDHTYDDKYDAICNVCGFVREAECAHKNVITLPGKEATCSKTGLTEGKKCGDCGETIIEQEIIPATGVHTYESKGTPSDDYATVFVTYTCSSCGDMYSETIAPSNFTLSWETRYMLGYNGEGDGTFIIPACFQHNGVWYRVTEIGYEAFTWEDQFVNIIIPDSVTRIGFYAFNNCGSLTDITIGKGVTYIEWGAFPYCGALKNFTVVEGNIEYYVEGNCLIERSFEAVIKGSANSVIPQGIKMIVHFAFASCENLTQITIPNSVTTIHYNAFDCCFDLTSITFEGTIAEWNVINKESGWDNTIGNYIVYCTDGKTCKNHSYEREITTEPTATTNGVVTYTCPNCGDAYSESIVPIDFVVTSDNREMVGYTGEMYENLVIPAFFENGGTWYRVTRIGDWAFGGCNLLSVVIPEGVTVIGEGAFDYNFFLENAQIPESVTTIESYGFAHCFKLISIALSDNVTSIAYDAFLGCGSVTSITVGTENSAYYVDGNCLIERSTKALLKGCNNSVIPQCVTCICDGAFYFCKELTTVTIPNTVTSIGSQAFQECDKLTSIIIPDSVTSIGFQAFCYCNAITHVYYVGTEEEWATVTVASNNDSLVNATRYYYSETQPTTEGNFWHYVDGVPTVWEAYVAPNYSLGLEYTSNGDGTCYVSGIGTCKDADIIIPSTYDSLSVTAIGQNWNYVFGNNQNIRSVVIPDTVTYIDLFAFSGCENLESVTLGSNTFVDEMAFLDCTSLKIIHLPGNASVGGRAFDGCTALESITVDNAHPYYKSIDGNLYNKQGTLLIQYALGKSDTIFTLPNGVTEIGHYALSEAKNLKHIVLSYGLTTIGTAAFSNCNSLESIIIPASVTSIGIFNQEFAASGPVFAFAGCNNLNAIYYEGSVADWSQISIELEWDGTNPFDNIFLYYYSENQPTTEGNYWHYVDGVPTVWEIHIHNYTSVVTTEPTATANGIVTYTCSCGDSYTEELVPQDFTVTSNNREMVGYTGEENENLVIPAVFEDNGTWYRVTTIGDSAFGECFNLTSVTIPDSVTTIGDNAFWNCDNLTSVTIPDSVTTIGDHAFAHCDGFTSVTIGDSVATIGNEAFIDCFKLIEVINQSSLAITAGSWENGYVAYYAKEVHNGTTKIINQNDYLFYTYGGVNYLVGYVGTDTVLNLPESYNGQNYGIYQYAFHWWDNLTSVTIPDSVTTIGDHAFWSCDNLTSVTIPDSVTTIGDHAFEYCGGLMSVTIGDSVTTIGDSVTAIGSYAFYCCANLTSVTIGDSVATIGTWAFSSCKSLTSVTIGDSVTTIGHEAFSWCTNLTSITIPDSVATIGDSAFSLCTNLTSVTIPDSVTTIGTWAFSGCSNLTDVAFKGTVEQWNAIEKEDGSWNNSIPATEVICSDGVVSLV